MLSLDGSQIFAVVYNPFRQVWKMLKEDTCCGCSGLCFPWDKHTPYEPYCDIFGVWNEHDHVGIGYRVYPNEICKRVRVEESL